MLPHHIRAVCVGDVLKLDFRCMHYQSLVAHHVSEGTNQCRKVITELQRQSNVDAKLRAMLSSTGGVERYLSLTLAVRGDDMTAEEFQRASEFLSKLHTLGISDHIMSCAERGDQENRLHLQSMLSGEWCTRKCNTNAMKIVIDTEKVFKRPYICSVVVHKADENRNKEALMGCDVTRLHSDVVLNGLK
jgi:hypothetical protein